MLRHADEQSADHIDEDDDQARDRVALHELHGAVHRAIELAFPLQLAPALARGGLVDLAGVHVGVDRHLLARQRVKGEAPAVLSRL